MALINKFFPVKKLRSSPSLNSKSDSCLLESNKRYVKQRGILSQTQNNQPRNTSERLSSNGDSSSVSNRNGSGGQVRMLLFRECEVRGRRLLFDSGGGLGSCDEVSGGQQQKFKDEFQEIQLMKDMVFGSATLKYSGENVRVHDFSSDPWKGYEMMVSKVFLVPSPSAVHNARGSADNRSNLLVPPIDKVASATTADSGYTEASEAGTRESQSSELSGFWNSGSSLVPSANSQLNSASTSRTSFGSMTLNIPRIPATTRNAVSDSLLTNSNNNKSNSLNHSKKIRLAVALLFLNEQPSKQEISLRDIVFHHFSLLEHFVQRLQHNVLRAYFSRTRFQGLIQEAIRQFESDVQHVSSSSSSSSLNSDLPVYVALISSLKSASQQVAQRFMATWETVITETDTKLTHFFWSSLLSAVLTYHVNWLHSFVQQPVDFIDCGTRVLVLSKDALLARRLLHILSYFVRTGAPVNGIEASIEPTNSSGNNNKTTSTSVVKESSSDSQKSNAVLNKSSSAIVTCCSADGCIGGTTPMVRRNSQQMDNNTRYLRNYYDVRFQLSPDTLIAKRDGSAFASRLISSIAKNDFQDFHDNSFEQASVGNNSHSCGFFVGSIPDRVNPPRIESPSEMESSKKASPVSIQIPSLNGTLSSFKPSPRLNRWVYGSELNAEYHAGKALQSCDPSLCDWLHELQLDLRAATARNKTVSCIVANTETWEIQVLTCTEDAESSPPRIKQCWSPVTMSGQVASLVESTQLLWLMMRDSWQCLDHMENRLRFLCQKSEDLGELLSTSIGSWNVDRVTNLLDIETGDLPLLMAACSVHTPSVASMGGVTML